ncbi:MAG: hypothetical protein AAF806_21060 [Bacteroidota bacterium]
MKFMFKHLLYLALSFGMLSFTQIPSNRPNQNALSAHQLVTADTLTPVHNVYSKPVAHPDLKKHLPESTKEVSSVSGKDESANAFVVKRVLAVCKGNGQFIGGKPRFVSGVFRDTLTSSAGRDSIIITELSVLDCQSI